MNLRALARPIIPSSLPIAQLAAGLDRGGRRRRRAEPCREALGHDIGELGEDARGDNERGEHVLLRPKGYPRAAEQIQHPVVTGEEALAARDDGDSKPEARPDIGMDKRPDRP
eukprot:scaffold50439_cov54-Phaeocystis_antarctica.AAC.1